MSTLTLGPARLRHSHPGSEVLVSSLRTAGWGDQTLCKEHTSKVIEQKSTCSLLTSKLDLMYYLSLHYLYRPKGFAFDTSMVTESGSDTLY